ncbi:MAG: DUF3575 domain-containing protein [Bacteroidia bacterium]|nr:DUF3575 domain-containing protein [Bacteroidia bacterium]
MPPLRKYLISLVCITLVHFAKAQANYVFFDPIQLVSKFYDPNPAYAQMRFGVGYERLLSHRFSAAALLNYGQVGGTRVKYYSLGKEVDIYSGMRLILQGRFYTAGKDSKRFAKGSGLFVGPYVGFMTGKEIDYFPISGKLEIRGNVTGLGIHGGYKFLIKNRISIEPQLGFPVLTTQNGFNQMNQEKFEIAMNLWTGLLNVGYHF